MPNGEEPHGPQSTLVPKTALWPPSKNDAHRRHDCQDPSHGAPPQRLGGADALLLKHRCQRPKIEPQGSVFLCLLLNSGNDCKSKLVSSCHAPPVEKSLRGDLFTSGRGESSVCEGHAATHAPEKNTSEMPLTS